MRFFKSKKGLALLAGVVAVIAAAGGAYAYFTSTGTGSGTASVGTASAWSVAQTGTSVIPLYPDGPASAYPAGPFNGDNVATESYTVQNPSNGTQNLTHVVISVANGDGSAWSECAGGTISGADKCVGGPGAGEDPCTAADFSVGSQAAGASWTATALGGDFNAGQSKTGTVTVEMVDNGAAQDACQGLTDVPLYYSAS